MLTARPERLRDRARELAGSPDPGAAFVAFFNEVVDGAAHKLTIVDALADAGDELAEGAPAQAGEELREAFGELLGRAQDAGAVRRDAAAPEVYALMVGVSRAMAHADLPSPVRERMLAIVFDGLAPGHGAQRAAAEPSPPSAT